MKRGGAGLPPPGGACRPRREGPPARGVGGAGALANPEGAQSRSSEGANPRAEVDLDEEPEPSPEAAPDGLSGGEDDEEEGSDDDLQQNLQRLLGGAPPDGGPGAPSQGAGEPRAERAGRPGEPEAASGSRQGLQAAEAPEHRLPEVVPQEPAELDPAEGPGLAAGAAPARPEFGGGLRGTAAAAGPSSTGSSSSSSSSTSPPPRAADAGAGPRRAAPAAEPARPSAEPAPTPPPEGRGPGADAEPNEPDEPVPPPAAEAEHAAGSEGGHAAEAEAAEEPEPPPAAGAEAPGAGAAEAAEGEPEPPPAAEAEALCEGAATGSEGGLVPQPAGAGGARSEWEEEDAESPACPSPGPPEGVEGSDTEGSEPPLPGEEVQDEEAEGSGSDAGRRPPSSAEEEAACADGASVGLPEIREGELPQLAPPVDVGPAQLVAVEPEGLTPSLQQLRDILQTFTCERLGLTYHGFLRQLLPRACASGQKSFRRPVSFGFKAGQQPPLPPQPRRPPPPRARPATGADGADGDAVVVLDEEEAPAREERERSPAGEPLPADPYASRTAPLALLRHYLGSGRFLGLRDGFVAFEDDGVQYPAETPTPVRERPGGGALLSLGSLWLLAVLRQAYGQHARALCKKHGLAQVSKAHAEELLDFLLGRSDHCVLLLGPEDLRAAPPPEATWVARPAGGDRPSLIPLAQLQGFPGLPPLSDDAAQQLDKLRRRLARQAAERSSDEAAAGEVAARCRAAEDVEAALCQNEVEVAALASLLEQLQGRLEATDRELEAVQGRRRRLLEEHRADLAAARPGAAKRRRGPGPGAAAQGDPIGHLLALCEAAVPAGGPPARAEVPRAE